MRVPPPTFKLTTTQQMYDALSAIFVGRNRQAYQSQYDVGVCVRSVDAGKQAFKDVPLKGSAIEYGHSVKKAVGKVANEFYDSDGEYTSKGMIGDVYSDIYQLLQDQQSGDLSEIDMKEANDILISGMLELIKLTPRPLGDAADAIIKTKAKATSGTKYYLKFEFLEDPDKDFALYGQVFNSSKYQVKILDNRLDMPNNS